MSRAAGQEMVLPAVALRGLVVFPGMMLHFDVGREKSVAAIKAAMKGNQEVFLVAQKNMSEEDPDFDSFGQTGVVATVRQMLKLPGGSGAVRIAVEGQFRARLGDILSAKPHLTALVCRAAEIGVSAARRDYTAALLRRAKDVFDEYAENVPQLPPEFVMAVMDEEKPGVLADFIAGNIVLDHADRQLILDELNVHKRLEKLCVILTRESRLQRLEGDIHERVQEQMDKNQREYYLREQMKSISIELNDGVDTQSEVQELRDSVLALALDVQSEQKLLRECDRLERASAQSPEGAVIRTYLETCLALPWNKLSKEKLDLQQAERILEQDHYGMQKVKQRILEYLAVRKLSPDIKGQIICLVGPPGVGKTSVARSVARAMNRKYVRISLGGVRDEAEIRGHRKTYIGAMPGRIMAAMQQAGTANPLILLDEVDKLGNDYKGDPSSALLEVLDGEQNNSFRDHYVELPFDLSRVLFLTTANNKHDIPAPLLDRMEVIELGSYTFEEKLQIAKRHLLPKQRSRHGLSGKTLRVNDEALRLVIEGYTREAGVRALEQKIAALCRKAASRVANGDAAVSVKAANVEELLGARRFKPDAPREENEVGVVNGLAWTSVGGEILEIEAAVLDGSGKLELTGSLGNVMKESARAAVSYIRSRAGELQISPNFYKEKDIHIHVPEGAVPKDGPSAGVTITTALVSALSGAKALRDVAMTGEISLRGRVLPIGGLKEKSMAAYRMGMKTVLIPQDNLADLEEVDSVVKEAVTFVPVGRVDEVLTLALEPLPQESQPEAVQENPSLPVVEGRKQPRAGIAQ